MAVGPSSNLLSALSQLQNTRPTQPARTPPAAQNTAQTAATQKTSFAAQLGSIGNSIQVATEQRSAAPAPVQSQSRPIQTRGGLLGQHVNILV